MVDLQCSSRGLLLTRARFQLHIGQTFYSACRAGHWTWLKNATTPPSARNTGRVSGKSRRHFSPARAGRNIMCLRCSPIRRGASMWAMSAIMWWGNQLQPTAPVRLDIPFPLGLW